MSETLARRAPTNGTTSDATSAHAAPLRLGRCQAFVAQPIDSAQDRAIAQQDPDIAIAAPVARLHRMPVSLPTGALRWLRALARTLVERVRRPTDPSSPSPATGRSAMRLPFTGKATGFREFTLPLRLADGGALRLRVKSAGVSTRIARATRQGTP